MRYLNDVKRALKKVSLSVVVPVLSAVCAAGVVSPAVSQAFEIDFDRADKGPNVYLQINNRDTDGNDLGDQMSLPADKWYYDKDADGSYHLEFRLASDKKQTTRAEVEGERWRQHIRPFAELGFGKYSQGRIAIKGYFGLSQLQNKSGGLTAVDEISSTLQQDHQVDEAFEFQDGAGNNRYFSLLELPKVTVPGYECIGWNIEGRLAKNGYGSALTGEYLSSTQLYQSTNYYYDDTTAGKTSSWTVGRAWLWNDDWKDLFGGGLDLRLATFRGNPFSKGNVGSDMAFRGTGKGYVIVCTPIMRNVIISDVVSSSSHTLYFDLNGGSGATGNDGFNRTAFSYGGKSEYLSVEKSREYLSRTGYTFKGWNTSADGAGAWMDESTVLNYDTDLTVYAQWEGDPCSVTFNANGGSFDGNGTEITKTLAFGSKLSDGINAPSRKGYTFAGWYSKNNNGVTLETVTGNNITIYARWKANDITVKFFNNGTAYTTETMKADTPFNTVVKAPEKDGYVFKGWVTSMAKEDYVESALEDISVYAFFYKKDTELTKPVVPEIKTYTYVEVTPEPAADVNVKVDANGGTFGDKDGVSVTAVDYKVKSGTDLSAVVTEPTRTGYTFAGWYYGKDGNEGAGVAANNTTVYAHWKPVPCTVSFSAPTGAENVPGTQTVDYDYDTSGFMAPTMKGASFVGWSDTADGEGVVDKVCGDMTLYARFKLNTYSITFDANEGRFSGKTQETRMVQEGSGFDAYDVPAREGYEFTGWYTSKNTAAAGKVTSAEADGTVYAGWKEKTYTLVLDNNDGTGEGSSQEVYYNKEIGSLPSLTRDGYDFKGWNTSKAGTGCAITSTTVYPEREDMTIYGVWEKHAYTLSFKDGETVTARKIYVGENIGELPTVKKAKKKLEGWYIDGKPIGPTTVFDKTEDKAAVAKLEDGSYTIYYSMNDIPTGDEPGNYPVEQTAKFGDHITLAKSVDTLDGFTFKGWNTKADGSGGTYNAEAVVSDMATYDGDQTALFAQWSVNHYNIHFDANKPSLNGAVVEGTVNDIKDVAYTDKIAAPACAYTVTGAAVKAVFDGWNTKADGTGDAYAEGSELYALESDDGATATLYAQWHYELIAENTKIFVGSYEVTDDPIYSPVENPPFRLVVDDTEIDKDKVQIEYKDSKVIFTMSGDYRGTIEKGFILGKNPENGNYSFPEDYDNPNSTWKPGSTTPDPNATLDPNATIDPNATLDPNATGNPGTNPNATGNPAPTSTTIGLMTPKPEPSSGTQDVIEIPNGYELVTPPPSARSEYDYTITYCVLKGSVIENPVYGYNAGTGATLPDKVTRDGYNFKGWFSNMKFEGDAILSIGPSEKGDKLFFAKMLLKTEDPDENGNGNGVSTADPNASAQPGQGGIDKDCPFKENLVTNGGTVNGWHQDWTKDVIALPTDVNREGYTFGGWFLDPNFTGSPVTEMSRVDLVNGVKVYAKWIPNTYKINYVLNGIGKLPDGALATVTHGTSTKLAVPVSDTHNFAGWYTDASFKSEKVTETGSKVVSDLTYYAKWTVIQKTKGGLIYQISGTRTATLIGTTNLNIKELKVPKTVNLKCKGKVRKYKVSRIGGRAFQGCKKLEKVTVGGNVTAIGIYSFKNCKKLKTVTVNGNSLLKIRESAFSGDKNLKKVVIKSYKVNQIGKRAFRKVNKKAKIHVHKIVKKKYTKMIMKNGYQTPKSVKIVAL